MVSQRHFASDNNAGIVPEALEALQEANTGHVSGYGNDAITERARAAVAEIFETECAVYFVSTGTTANCLALSPRVASYQAVLAHEFSHLETDECNALGQFIPGAKILAVPGANGKIDATALVAIADSQRPVHSSEPAALSVTNATELGTVYRPEELAALSELARPRRWFFHVDGARFANAVAGSKYSPADLTWRSGIDVLSFGGTKNGLAIGDAIVFFGTKSVPSFEYRLKQSGQLTSKMRFLAAPWIGALRDGAWLKRASHANNMAARLEAGLSRFHQIRILFPREANAVFAKLPEKTTQHLHGIGWHFYSDVGPGSGARLMCSWDTTEEDVDRFVADAGSTLNASQ